jgi:light-regulated signal transduction histidine kinase (bacteriophytochrome)
VSAAVSEVLAELREAHPERRVETVVASGMRAEADADLLRAILANLLSNAWKFTSKHEQARIEVGVTDQAGERVFFCRDDGAGFDAENATRLFGAFQRMHQAEQFEGDGIGLAIVQRLVTRHGGRVWAESEVGGDLLLHPACLRCPGSSRSARPVRIAANAMGPGGCWRKAARLGVRQLTG